MSLPTGTVTFLFTDIEGSTRLWEQHPQAMQDALMRHDVLMHQAVANHDGVVFKTMGDAFCAAFATAPEALMAAFTAQQSLQTEPWPQDVSLLVRMALLTGTADERDGDYFGPALNRVARLLSTGHGEQALLSQSTYELTRDALPALCSLHDLGLHSLRDLARPEQVYQLCHPDLVAKFPPLKSLDYLPNNLPQQMTSFIGRERELTQVKDLLGKTKLLTLTGSGGCGKTRLSLQTAAEVLDTFPDGVWLVELAPITDAGLVPQTVATVLDIAEQPGKTHTQALIESLKTKAVLLVLDNCEHVLTTCATLADTLLRNCPSVKVLASSREGLGIAGELTYPVPSLSLPDPRQVQSVESLSQYEAVQLFIERATSSRPSFAVTDANAPALASVCHRLDGIPLALELAAARIRSLTVEEIHDRLDNRFRLLTGGSRTALPRQQTLRALIDWSYDLLTAPEKILLCRLSVFAGGWTLSAAESVCTDQEIEDWEVLDLLTSLVDKSLVLTEQTEGQTRYRCLETVRQYARDRLIEGDAGMLVRQRHRDYFLAMAEETAPKLLGAEQVQWLSVLETEHDNLRQAITFCLDAPDGGAPGLRLGAALHLFWQIRGHLNEGREQLKAMLAHPTAQENSAARAEALNGAGILTTLQNEYSFGQTFFSESLVIRREIGDRDGMARTLNNLGCVAFDQSEYVRARTLWEECLSLYREMGDRDSTADTIGNLGYLAIGQGDYERARSLIEESLVIYRELGERRGIGFALGNLGRMAMDQGDYLSARTLLEESLAIRRDLADKYGIAGTLNEMGNVCWGLGDFDSARALYGEGLILSQELGERDGLADSHHGLGLVADAQDDLVSARAALTESLTIRHALGDQEGIACSLEGFATVVRHEGKPGRAVRLWGAAEAMRAAIEMPLPPNRHAVYDQQLAMLQEALGEDAFQSAWAEGRAMSMEQAVAEALGEEAGAGP